MLPDSLRDAPVAFTAARFQVRAVDLDRRTGGRQRREVVVPADAVLIVPVLDDGRLVMIRNERFAVGQTLWEFPAGTLEPGEAPDACARREVVEETGYEAGRIEKLLQFYTCPGFCTELMHVYLAQNLRHVGQNLDETEKIEVEVVTAAQALAMVKGGQVQDGKTIASLLYCTTFIARGDSGS